MTEGHIEKSKYFKMFGWSHLVKKYQVLQNLPKVEDFLDLGTSKSTVDDIIKEGSRFFQIHG
jgi:hypothetical protein